MGIFDKLTGKKSGILEDAKKGLKEHIIKPIKQVKKDVEQEFGVEEGAIGSVKEFFASSAEKLGIKDPRVGKSFTEVIKAGFGMLKVTNSSPEKQDAALEKFETACNTFSKAMKALFKNQVKSHSHESDAPKSKKVSAKSVSHSTKPSMVDRLNHERANATIPSKSKAR